MIQTTIFKPIKDKQTRFLYESVANQLNHIETLSTIDALDVYIKSVLAYLNGFTEKNKLFKDLRKTHQIHPNLYMRWLIEFAKFKQHYIEFPKIKRLDDLMLYAEHQSTFSYLLLITDEMASNHLVVINNLARIDVLSNILLSINSLKKNGRIHLPIQLIEDYHLEESLDGTYMINERFIALWELIAYKLKLLIKDVNLYLNDFDQVKQNFIMLHLKSISDSLMNYAKNVLKIK